MPALTEIDARIGRVALGLRSAATLTARWIQRQADAVDRSVHGLTRRQFSKLQGRKALLTLASELARDLFLPPDEIANTVLGSVNGETCADRAARLLALRGAASAQDVIDGLFEPVRLAQILDSVGRGHPGGLELLDPLDVIEIDGVPIDLDDGVHDDPAVASAAADALAGNIRDAHLATAQLLDLLQVGRIVRAQLRATNRRFSMELFDAESMNILSGNAAAAFITRFGLGRLFNRATLSWLRGLAQRLALEQIEAGREITLDDAANVAMANVPGVNFRIYGRLGSVLIQIMRLDDVATPLDAMIKARPFADNGEAGEVEAGRGGAVDWGAFDEMVARNRERTPIDLVGAVGALIRHLADGDDALNDWEGAIARIASDYEVEPLEIEDAYNALLDQNEDDQDGDGHDEDRDQEWSTS